ncbi:MAG: periplasmic heavy metal sensor [Proteobacteria bacterium]|nr:periplasmic heavy metal sensor [Pseudomonadota bacterium]
MNNKWLKILFIFSLSVNGAVLGALGYSAAKQYWGNTMAPDPVPVIGPENLPPRAQQSRAEFQKKLWQERSLIQEQREDLARLLMQEPPDKQKIEEKIKAVTAHQEKLQQAIVDQILKETGTMTPEQRKLYLSTIQGRMCPQGMGGWCGRGPRSGGRMGFRRNMPCP